MSSSFGKIKLTAAKVLLLTLATVSWHHVCVYAAGEEAHPDEKVYSFLEHSAFIGNSLGEGLTMYNRSRDCVPLGEATMLTKASYSFANDMKANTPYLPKIGGVPMQAKDAIKQSGASYVFVCMGTNDLVGRSGAKRAYDSYRKYLSGIMAENPGILLFVESCPPTAAGSGVSNEKVTEFNGYMRSYCNVLPHLYYVDIAGPLSDNSGYLAKAYSAGDGIHLSAKAYAVWTETIQSYIAGYIEEKAEEARKKNELERAAARRNYEKCMRQMEKAKQIARCERIKEQEDALEDGSEDTGFTPMTRQQLRAQFRDFLREQFQVPLRQASAAQPDPHYLRKLQALLKKQP